MSNKFSGAVIKFQNFRKTNGTMNNVFGQMIYTIQCDIDIKFIADGWKKGNGLEGYWNNFNVYASEPDLYASGEQYMYATKRYPNGTLLTLGCVAEMNNTDNGFEVKKLSVKSVTHRGVDASYQTNNTKVTQQATITSSYTGDFKDGKKEGKGNQIYEDGSIYKGEWKNDKRYGYGTFLSKDLDLYKGYWKNDKKDSVGIRIFPITSTAVIESKFEGTYKDDKEFNGVLSMIDWKGRKKELIVKEGVLGKWVKIKDK